MERTLRERLPGEDIPYVMMYYVTVKNWLAQDETLDFDGAAGKTAGVHVRGGDHARCPCGGPPVMAEDGMASRM